MTRITIEANGYRWLVHGTFKSDKWQTHLIELLGSERLDVPIDRTLKTKLQEEIAKFLKREISDVRLTADLILAW